MAMELIETIEVGAGGAASIEFTSIPQDGVDLLLVVSGRVGTSTIRNVRLHLNNETSGTNYSQRNLYGDGSAAGSDSEANQDRIVFPLNGSGTTSNTFSSNAIYLPNYAGSAAKSVAIETVVENNATTSWQQITAGLWNNTAAISTITISDSSVNISQYSTASLYKIS